MKSIEVKEIASLEGLERIRKTWNELLASSIDPTVFGSWEWQYLSADLFADQHPIILSCYDEGSLVAVLPLRHTKIKIGEIFSITAWSCLGGGLTDYNAFVVREGYLSSVIPSLADFLSRKSAALDLTNVFPGSPLDRLTQYLAEHRWRRAVYESKAALMTELPGDYDSFLKTRKKKFRKTLRNNQNYMDRKGGYSYHAEEATKELLDALISLHTSRWQDKGEEGALARKKIKEFHHRLHDMPERPFDIQYYTIRHNDRIIAILYGFVMDKRFYAYLSGFDMEHNRISPGNMILDSCLKTIIDQGIMVFDLLRGDMKYKQTWATTVYDMQDSFLFPATFSGWWFYRMMKTTLALKRILPSSVKKKLKSLLGRGSSETEADD
jgi:CelD/BcsL family acetyltransferase involved in cellulose biosynthesis